jgi:hypothetical protein
MKIVYKTIPSMTLEEFAEKHDLTMIVEERREPSDEMARYFAYFDHADIGDGCILTGAYGNGCTPESAIEQYARTIDTKHLVVNAGNKNRVEIDVPHLITK